jgi:hypothetical protein
MATGNIGRGGGIYFYWNDNSMLINNLIVNNSATGNEGDGGGLYLLDENTPAVINNTIANNHAITDGGALYCRWTSKPVFINSILSGNTAGNDTNQVFLYDEASDPDFLYCDIQGGQADFSLNGNFYFGDYENNISADPCFPWPTAGSGSAFNGLVADWTEGPASPCINAGNPEGYYPATDLAGKPRVVGTFIDIGAFEYQWPVGTPPDRIRCEVSVTPNPCTDATTLHFPFRVDHGKLLVYNAIGDIAAVFDNVNGDSYRLDCNGFTSGVYYFELRSEGRKIARGRLVVAG